jgi:hypothetical protein
MADNKIVLTPEEELEYQRYLAREAEKSAIDPSFRSMIDTAQLRQKEILEADKPLEEPAIDPIDMIPFGAVANAGKAAARALGKGVSATAKGVGKAALKSPAELAIKYASKVRSVPTKAGMEYAKDPKMIEALAAESAESALKLDERAAKAALLTRDALGKVYSEKDAALAELLKGKKVHPSQLSASKKYFDPSVNVVPEEKFVEGIEMQSGLPLTRNKPTSAPQSELFSRGVEEPTQMSFGVPETKKFGYDLADSPTASKALQPAGGIGRDPKFESIQATHLRTTPEMPYSDVAFTGKSAQTGLPLTAKESIPSGVAYDAPVAQVQQSLLNDPSIPLEQVRKAQKGLTMDKWVENPMMPGTKLKVRDPEATAAYGEMRNIIREKSADPSAVEGLYDTMETAVQGRKLMGKYGKTTPEMLAKGRSPSKLLSPSKQAAIEQIEKTAGTQHLSTLARQAEAAEKFSKGSDRLSGVITDPLAEYALSAAGRAHNLGSKMGDVGGRVGAGIEGLAESDPLAKFLAKGIPQKVFSKEVPQKLRSAVAQSTPTANIMGYSSMHTLNKGLQSLLESGSGGEKEKVVLTPEEEAEYEAYLRSQGQ